MPTSNIPVFDWIVLSDRSEIPSLDMASIKTLTSWYFSEQKNGRYDTSDISESLIEKRVKERLTDENVFYLMNIEVWDNDGSMDEIRENMKILKRTAVSLNFYPVLYSPTWCWLTK